MGEKIRRKERKKKEDKRREKRKKKGEVNKTKGREKEGGKKIEERKKKEKRVGIKYLNKRKYCVGTEPSALLYIGILVSSTTTGHGGSVVIALASQAKVHKQKEAKGRGSIPSCDTSFFSHKYFLSSLSNLCRVSN